MLVLAESQFSEAKAIEPETKEEAWALQIMTHIRLVFFLYSSSVPFDSECVSHVLCESSGHGMWYSMCRGEAPASTVEAEAQIIYTR